MTAPDPSPADTADTATPPIPVPVWHEYARTITVQAYKVEVSDRILTVEGPTAVGPDNYVVNDGGFISVQSAEDFEALYDTTQDTTPPKK